MILSMSLGAAVWGHEEVCVDFQANNNSNCLLGYPFAIESYPSAIETNHSFRCKSALNGVISPEMCDSGPCKFKSWIWTIALLKLIDLSLNMAVLIIAVRQNFRWEYSSQLQIGRHSESVNFGQLALMILDALICGMMINFGSQFFPEIDELVDVGCLSISAEAVGYLLSGIPGWLWAQFVCQVSLTAAFLANKYYYNKYVRRSRLQPKDPPSNDDTKGLEFKKEINGDRMVCHFFHVSAFFMIEVFGLFFSAVSFLVILNGMSEVQDLLESATTQGDTTWCFYCRGERHAMPNSKQNGTHIAMLHFGGWVFVILNSVALLGTVVAALCSVQKNQLCKTQIDRDSYNSYHSPGEDSVDSLAASAAAAGLGDNGILHRPGRNSFERINNIVQGVPVERNQNKQNSPNTVSDIKDLTPGDPSKIDFTASGAGDTVIHITDKAKLESDIPGE